jgi:2-polyprenyl-3-methyl-5-hydroxy-6-metoxy-1,4-benzoquinol methylase
LLPPIADEPFSILDFGCGYGALIEYLKSKYISFSYTGYDISEEMINQAKKYLLILTLLLHPAKNLYPTMIM